MGKINIGDYVYATHHKINGTVIGDRGGYVGRWTVQLDEERYGRKVIHASSRDLVVINPVTPTRQTRISTAEKLDMLMEYLGVEILDEPKIIKIQNKSED